MTNKQRIKQLETRKAQANNGMGRIFVYKEHEDTGRLDGVPMSCAEFEKIKTDNDTVLVIRYASEAIKDGDE
jgi:hypothetical protein